MENILDFLKEHYQFVLIGVGALFLIGAIFNWEWVTSSTKGQKAKHSFIFEMWGDAGYRIIVGICGLALMVCGIMFLIYA